MSLKKPNHYMCHEYCETEGVLFISSVATKCSEMTGHMKEVHFKIKLSHDEDLESLLDQCKIFLEMPRILNKKVITRFYRSITFRR